MKQVIILTGATGGLGSILAKRMLKECDGELICIYRNEHKFHSIYKKIEENIISYKTYDKDDYKELLKIVDSLDSEEIVVVLNAFSIVPIKRIGEFTYKEIQQMVNGNIIQNITLINCNPEFKVVSYDPGVMDTPMQNQIRETDRNIFSEVDRFISYKTEGKLISPEITAEELIKNYIVNWKAETLREKYKVNKE